MKPVILASLAAAVGLLAQAQSPSEALLSRSGRLAAQGNYAAALDELRFIDVPTLSADARADYGYLRALYLYRTGDFTTALEAFDTFLQDNPAAQNRGNALKGRADCLLALGRYSEASEAYGTIPEGCLTPADMAEVCLSGGSAALYAGDTALAEKRLDEAAAYPGTAPAANFVLGTVAFNAGDYQLARERFAKAAGSNLDADFYLTAIDFAEGEFSKASQNARRLLAKGSSDATITAELNRIAGESLYNLGDRREAIPYLKKYISQLPEGSEAIPTTLYILGADAFENGDYALALEYLDQVTARGTGAIQQSAYLFAGQSLLATGDTSAAILAFDKATRTNDDPAVREAAFYNYAAAKFAGAGVPFGSTAEVFEKFLKLYPNGPYSDRVGAYLASGYMADHDYARALERLDAISDSMPAVQQARQRTLLALALEATQSGDYAAASRYLTRAEELARVNAATAAEVDLARADLLYRQGEPAKAAEKYRSYLHRAPKEAANRPAAMYGLAYSLYNTADASGAATWFTQALDRMNGATEKADILNRLGDISFSQGDFAKAEDYYARAFEQSPSTADYALLAGARMKGLQRDYAGKLDALELFSRSFSSSVLMPEALLETTQAQISLGRNADAVATYRRLIADYPLTAQGRRGYLQLAMTLLDMGRTDEAIDAYRSVISLYPTSAEAAQASSLLKNLYSEAGNAGEYLAFIDSVDNAPKIDPKEAEELQFKSAQNLYHSKGDTSALEKFANENPSSAHAPEALCIVLDNAVAQKDTAAVESLSQRILDRYPDSTGAEHALLAQAKAASAAGKLPEALDLFKRLADKASDAETATEARLGLMRTARDMGDHELAGSTADAILSSSAGSATMSEARFTKASSLAAAGDTDRALAIWLEMAATPADLYGARSAFEAADAMHDAGNDTKALATAQKFVNSGSPHRYWVARTFILISDIYASQGKDFEAREYLEALKENYPGEEADIFMMIETRLSGDK